MRYFAVTSSLLLAVSCVQKGRQASFENFNRSLSSWKAPDYRRDSHEQSLKEHISVDGRSAPSEPAREGSEGSYGSYGGGQGGLGGLGADGSAGQPAGALTARVRYTGQDESSFLLNVKGVDASGRPLERSLQGRVDEPAFFLLTANGGRGQNGGRGGDGGEGGRGYPAPNPSFENQTTFGGEGGRGGTGGRGGRGGDGGDAGPLTIEVPEDQTEVLWHLRAESNGAPGGEKGPGGAGGAGGSGGDPAFRETVAVGTKTVTSTNAKGELESNTETTYAFRSPGSSGSSGNQGSAGEAGEDGKSQSPKIRILDRQGNPTGREYDHLFEIELEDMQISESIPDGIFEPGEVIWLTSLALGNRYEMPSPAKKNDFALVEDGGISPPNAPAQVAFESGFKGLEKKRVQFEDHAHFFTLFNPRKEEHLNFATHLDDRESATLNKFRFLPKLIIGGGQMTLTGGRSFNIEPPVLVSQDPEFFRTQYPIISNSDEVTYVPIHIQNLSQTAYGQRSQFVSHLPGEQKRSGARRIKVELAYLNHEEAGRPEENYLLTDKFGAYLERDGKRFAETQNLKTSPLSFEIDEIPAGGVQDLKAGFDIWDDTGLTVGSRLVAEFRVYVSPFPGDEPTKLIWTDPIDFLYTAEFRFETDHRFVVFNKQVQCEFTNAPFKKKRIIDRMYIGKSFNKDNPNDATNREWNVQFATAWAGQPRTPIVSFGINEHFDYFDIFTMPETLLYSEEIRDFLNKVYIPKLQTMKDLKPIHQMTECSYIPSDRWDFLLRREILPRQFGGHIILNGVRTILSPAGKEKPASP